MLRSLVKLFIFLVVFFKALVHAISKRVFIEVRDNYTCKCIDIIYIPVSKFEIHSQLAVYTANYLINFIGFSMSPAHLFQSTFCLCEHLEEVTYHQSIHTSHWTLTTPLDPYFYGKYELQLFEAPKQACKRS